MKDYFNGFKDGIKINNDLNNKVEGPHWDIMADLRKEINGVEKVRISSDGNVISGETQVGKIKIRW